MASFSVTPRKPKAIPIFHPSGQRVDVEAIQQEKPTFSPLEPPPNVDASRSSGIARKSAAPATRSRNTVVPVASPDSYKAHTPRKQPNDGRWTPDLYAPAYVPLYLQAINKSYAIYRDCTPLKTTDFDAYIRTFSGSSVLEPAPVPEMPLIQNIPATLSRHTKSLAPINYEHYFNECLLAETYNHSVELARLNLYNVKVDIFKANMQLYSLKIPGLRDGAPRIGLGDIVLIRQIVPSSELPQQGAEWYLQRHGHDGLVAPGFTGQQHHASVWGVNNATELVVLRMNHFIPSLLQCNVIFQVQPSLFVPLWGAVSKVCDGYSSDWPGPDLEAYGRPAGGIQNRDSWIRRMLLPGPGDTVMQTELSLGPFQHEWFDPDLNIEQMKAVDAIVSRNFGSVPFLISGVPGSGKTKTLVECALQLLRFPGDVEQHILICAPSNPAADTLALRLSKYLGRQELFRMNGYARTFGEVADALMPFTYTNDETFSLPDFKTMMKFKVVVTTCHDADILVRARLTNADLMKLVFETVLPVAPGTHLTPEKALHWTTLIVDEAAQATEPAVCVPLTVVASPFAIEPSEGKSALPVVVMAGDQHQLGPRVFSTDTALSVSVFERLSSRPIYSDHPFSRRNAGRYKRLTKEMLPMPRAAFTNLIRNYRSHPSILAIPSVLFYSDSLVPCATPAHPESPVPTWSEWRSSHKWPVLFACNTAPDGVEEILHGPAGSGLYNHGEALKALYYAESLLQHSMESVEQHAGKFGPKRIRQDEIAVISPFSSQVAYLRRVFRASALHKVNIGPLEAFQGLETRFLIICTTRTRTDPRFVEQDQALGLGLIGERKRFNVALTRAQEGVVVIGNPSLLGTGPLKDEVWHAFLSFCARNGCWDPETRHTEAKNGSNSTASGSDNGAAEARRSAAYWAKRLAGPAKAAQTQHAHPEGDGSGDEEEGPRFQGAYVSSLEYVLLYDAEVERGGNAGRQLGGGHCAQESAMWTSGLAAEQVLRGVWDDEN